MRWFGAFVVPAIRILLVLIGRVACIGVVGTVRPVLRLVVLLPAIVRTPIAASGWFWWRLFVFRRSHEVPKMMVVACEEGAVAVGFGVQMQQLGIALLGFAEEQHAVHFPGR